MAKNKPNIRFKGFEGNWTSKPFSDVYLLASEGGTPSTSIKDYYEGGNIPFVKIEDTEQKYIYKSETYITEKGMNNSSAWLVPNDSIIFTNGATIGNVAINKVPVTTKQGILGVVPDNSKYDLEYLFYVLSTDKFQNEVKIRQSKGTFATIILRILDKIEVPYTSPIEQGKIGEYFKQLDELIEAREKKLDKLRQFKMAMLDKMFPKEGESVPAVRFRGFTEPWKLMPITECVTFDKGRGYSKGSLKPLGTPILLYGMLYTDYNTNIDIINQYAQKEEWAKISIGNEVVVPASGETAEDIARASAINLAGVILGGDLNIIYPNRKLSPAFLALEITYGNSHHKLVKKAQGVSVVHLHNSDISELDIMIPSIKEQQKIGEFFRSQNEEINNLQEQINKLKTFKQACLSQMFV